MLRNSYFITEGFDQHFLVNKFLYVQPHTFKKEKHEHITHWVEAI